MPRGIGTMWRARRDLPPRVQLQELLRHFENRNPRFLALLLPAIPTELVQTGRRRVCRHIAGTAIAFDLIDAVQRHVQSIATFVLDDGRFDRTFAHEDFFNPAIDPDPVLQMHDVVAGLERADGVKCRAGAVLARTTHAAITAKDLVIGEDTDHVWDDEAAAEHTYGQRRGDWSIFTEQFVEAFSLSGVVA